MVAVGGVGANHGNPGWTEPGAAVCSVTRLRCCNSDACLATVTRPGRDPRAHPTSSSSQVEGRAGDVGRLDGNALLTHLQLPIPAIGRC